MIGTLSSQPAVPGLTEDGRNVLRWAFGVVCEPCQEHFLNVRKDRDQKALADCGWVIPSVAQAEVDWQRRLSRFNRKASYGWLGIWHLQAKNRILGVKAEGKKPLDTAVLEHVCSHYEII